MTITVAQWQEHFLDPLLNVVAGNEVDPDSIDELESGLAGFTLDGILAVREIDGQEATDWDCVEMIHRLIEAARLASLKLERAEG